VLVGGGAREPAVVADRKRAVIGKRVDQHSWRARMRGAGSGAIFEAGSNKRQR
jgi:hypothetical protein